MSQANGNPVGRRILGIDPGLQVTGYAIIEAGPSRPFICEAGVIRSAEGRDPADMAPRLQVVYNSLVEVISQFRPGIVVVEQLYAHYDHPRTAILIVRFLPSRALLVG